MNETENISFRFFKIILVTPLIVVSIAGCALIPTKKFSHHNKKSPALYSANVMRPALLKEGASVVVVPFTAGTDVEATQDLQRVSLMVLKGIVGTLQNDNIHLKVFSSEDAGKADLVIQGHITRRESSVGSSKKWLFHSKAVVLALEARVMERKTGDLVLIFSQEQKADLTQKDELTLAQEMGKDIAAFLLRTCPKISRQTFRAGGPPAPVFANGPGEEDGRVQDPQQIQRSNFRTSSKQVK